MKGYKVSHITVETGLKDYIRNYRDADKFIVYCKQCDRYNACWSCPPFDFDTAEVISAYDTAYLTGTKILLDDDVIKENTGWERCTKITYLIIEEVRRNLDRRLLSLEREFPGSRAFFAGTCHICPQDECERIKGKPCIAPERIRPSLESFGFDMAKTAAELLNIEMKWSHNG
jgi:predicted metal-binding protein